MKSINHSGKTFPSLGKIHCALLFAQLSYGFGSVIARLGLSATNPIFFSFVREAIAGPLLCIIAYLTTKTLPNFPDDIQYFWKPGLCLFSGQFFYIMGVKLSSSAFLAAAWQLSQPIIGIIVGWFLKTEQIDRYKISGIFCCLTGGLFMLSYDVFSLTNIDDDTLQLTDAKHTFISNICFVFNCSASVGYLYTTRTAFKLYHTATVTGYSYMAASVFMGIASLILYLLPGGVELVCPDCINGWTIPLSSMGALIYFILFQSMFSYSLVTWANNFTDPSINMTYTIMQPLAAALLSQILISGGFVDVCGSQSIGNACLSGRSKKDFGAIGIFIGLYFVIVSERKKQAKLQKNKHDTDADDTVVLPLMQTMSD